MSRATGKSRRRVGARTGKNHRRQVAAARNLAAGMNPTEALVEAGYSETTAEKRAYQVVRQPIIQSLLTDSCERIMSKRKMDFDAILEPLFDSLHANIIVKSAQYGTKELDLPDHAIRMAASDRLIDLYRTKGGQCEEEEEKPDRPRVMFQINFIKTPTKHNHSPVVIDPMMPLPTSSQSERVPPAPRVAFIKSGKR